MDVLWTYLSHSAPGKSPFAADRKNEVEDVEVLLQRRAESDQGCAVPRRNRSALRRHTGRHPQGRAAQAGVPGNQSERETAGYRRRRRDGVRLERDPALSRRKDRQVPAGEDRQGARRIAVMDVLRVV